MELNIKHTLQERQEVHSHIIYIYMQICTYAVFQKSTVCNCIYYKLDFINNIIIITHVLNSHTFKTSRYSYRSRTLTWSLELMDPYALRWKVPYFNSYTIGSNKLHELCQVAHLSKTGILYK